MDSWLSSLLPWDLTATRVLLVCLSEGSFLAVISSSTVPRIRRDFVEQCVFYGQRDSGLQHFLDVEVWIGCTFCDTTYFSCHTTFLLQPERNMWVQHEMLCLHQVKSLGKLTGRNTQEIFQHGKSKKDGRNDFRNNGVLRTVEVKSARHKIL